jgi:hypothetical protein
MNGEEKEDVVIATTACTFVASDLNAVAVETESYYDWSSHDGVATTKWNGFGLSTNVSCLI